MKDSTEADIVYDKPFDYYQRGRRLARNFAYKICETESCNEQVKVFYIDRNGKRSLCSDKHFSDRRFHSSPCASLHIQDKARKRKAAELKKRIHNSTSYIRPIDVIHRFLSPGIKKDFVDYMR